MVRRLMQYIGFLKKVDRGQFFYLNYFCKSVIRTDKSKIIPYKNSVLDIDPSARIYLGGGDIEIGCDLLKRSKTETRVRMGKGAVWCSTGGCKISYGSTLEVLKDAVLDCKYFTMNSNSTMIAAVKITLGQDVMIARNVTIYDSDFHQLLNKDGATINHASPVVIGDHVWLATNVMVLKGTTIGEGSVIGAQTVVSGTLASNTLFQSRGEWLKKEEFGNWSRKRSGI